MFIARVGLPFVTTLAKRRRYSFQILVVDQSDRIKSLSRFRNCVSYVSREEEEETRGNISYSVNGVYLEGDKLDGVVVPAAQALDLDANCRPIESRRFVPEVGSRWAPGVNESMPRFEHTVRVTAFYWRAFGG